MYRKECLINIGLYNEKFKMREGHEINQRFKKKFKIGRLELPLYKYRMHEKNRTKNLKRVSYFDKLLKVKMIFIAEIGMNYNGNLSLSYELIKQAKYSGASIVKFQLGWRDKPGEINQLDEKNKATIRLGKIF